MNNFLYFFQMHNGLYLLFFLFFLEFLLRLSPNLSPGKIENYANFPSNEQITLLPFYTTDEAGIYKLDKIIIDSLKTYIQQNGFKQVKDLYFSDNISDIIYDFNLLKENIVNHSFPNQQLSEFELFAKNTLLNNRDHSKIIEDYLIIPF
jgi:hypothetical protein